MLVRRFSHFAFLGFQLALGVWEDVLDGSHLRAKASPSFRQVLLDGNLGVSQDVRDMQRIPNCFQIKYLPVGESFLENSQVVDITWLSPKNKALLKGETLFFGGDLSFQNATISRCARTVNATPENRRAFVELMRTNSNVGRVSWRVID